MLKTISNKNSLYTSQTKKGCKAKNFIKNTPYEFHNMYQSRDVLRVQHARRRILQKRHGLSIVNYFRKKNLSQKSDLVPHTCCKIAVRKFPIQVKTREP